MITLKDKEEIKKMRKAGLLASQTLDYITPFIKAGISTEEINQLCHNFIVSKNAYPAPLNYNGFPKSVCTSINNVVCHGIPKETDILKAGDIINIDVTVNLNGFYGDTSRMFAVGKISKEAENLIKRTEKAMYLAIDAVKPFKDLSIVGKTIEKYISKFNYGIVRDYTGHGIGKKFHEDPYVLHFDNGLSGIILKPGMIFTIEPMINSSSNYHTITDKKDNWTVYTKDNALSAQTEHTILVTEKGSEILTKTS
jgi:methionyl aminopeptidase